MGCIVSWDLMLAYAKRPEFAALRATGNKVGTWLTLGCPLGDVRRADLNSGLGSAHALFELIVLEDHG